MNILRNYTIREMAVPFLMTLMLFTFVFLTGSLVKMADSVLNKGVELFEVTKILSLVFPEVFSFTLPMSALAAVILAVGSFAQNNELRAMKAIGINPIKIMYPVLIIAFLISLFALVFNDQVVTESNFAKRKLVKQIIFKNPMALFVPNKFIKEIDNYIFHVKGVNGSRLDQVIIYQLQKDKPTRTIIAEHGKIITSPTLDELTLELYNGTIDEPNEDELYKLDFETYTLPPMKLQSAAGMEKKTKELQFHELLTRLKQSPTLPLKDRLRLRTEFHKKIAFSLGTFVFVLIGLPTAIIVKHGELIWSFGISMMMVVVYYVLYIWAGSMAINGILPPEIALWLPNFVLIGLGLFLMRWAIDS